MIGIILSLGSVFAILAAHQTLPTGLNAFNQLHAGSYAIGYGVLAAGFITALISAVTWRNFTSKITIERKELLEHHALEETHAKKRIVQGSLADNEMLAIYYSGESRILTKEDDYYLDDKSFHSGNLPEEGYKQLRAHYQFTTLETLYQREAHKGQ